MKRNGTKPKPVSEATVSELKAAAYDRIVELQRIQAELQQINSEIAKRQQLAQASEAAK